MKSALFVGAIGGAVAKTYFTESFKDAKWEDRWTKPANPKNTLGEWKWTGGKYPGAAGDKGIQTGEDARHYALTAPLDAAFDNSGKDLIIAYTVKHEQHLDCGGAYIKLLPKGYSPTEFNGDSEYASMFGPDVCGYSTRKTHVIFPYKGTNKLIKKNVKVETDRLSHRYTLIVHPDNTYEVDIDGSKVESGNLVDDWDFLPPKTIKDPAAKKPADWVDAAQIPDPTDVKPAGHDDIPAKIPDPAAKKPEDWDEEEDGEWTAPVIDNPEFKGEWKPRMIPNPDYKGPWVHPEIDNPDYAADDQLYHVCKPCGGVGFDLWQVKAGTIFDDIIVTDSLEEARAFAKETFEAKKDAEKKAFDAIEEAKKAEEEAARKAAAEAAAAAGGDEEDEEDEDKDEL